MPRKPSKNSARQFILSHPDKTSAEIIELGKAAGFPKITAGYVHTARYSAKKSAGGSKKGTAKKAAKKGRGRGPVTKDKAARALEKLASKGVASVARQGRPRKLVQGEGSSGPLVSGGSLESQFAALAVELGISRAESILRRVREVLEKLTF